LIHHIEKIQTSRPGTQILRTSDLDLHHQIGRFNWELRGQNENVLLKGIDIVFFNEDSSKIEKIIGFWRA